MPLHIETPLIESRSLSSAGHCSVWLKLEALQPPGSFKIRGIGAACEEYSRRGARRFVSSSGGNAGLAVAYAGRRLATPVTVVVPETTSARARELLRHEAAEIIVHGASWHEANVLALSMIEEADAFLHPFDDPLLWHGHATLVDELARSMPAPDAVVLSVGGGGLLCGVIEGLHRNGLGRVPVIAVETAGAASFNRSLLAGQRGRTRSHQQRRHVSGRQTHLRARVSMVDRAPDPQRRRLRPRCARRLRALSRRPPAARRASLWCRPGAGLCRLASTGRLGQSGVHRLRRRDGDHRSDPGMVGERS